ncbi:hypothetical protein HMPREF0758_0192 [Serratia odorifera DSM 4582]|uniref:Uncharacterized protein n=1 Tax=Serratia odorifera DSM 4582 TaxID=667129 RepID=D4DW92_SEROD|nr:hypothetical protein HMPREF0758_0192 [Serratia odorifera DSM 4582]
MNQAHGIPSLFHAAAPLAAVWNLSLINQERFFQIVHYYFRKYHPILSAR